MACRGALLCAACAVSATWLGGCKGGSDTISDITEEAAKVGEGASNQADTWATTFDDHYQSMQDWVSNAKGNAHAAVEQSVRLLEAQVDALQSLVGSVSYIDILKISYPTCGELADVTVAKLDDTFEGKIDDMFASQVCTSNWPGQECKEHLTATLADITFDALWFPMSTVVGGRFNPVATDVLKRAAKTFATPYLEVMVEPAASHIQQAVQDQNPNFSGLDSELSNVKSTITVMKDVILRHMRTGCNPICDAIGLPLVVDFP
mmetsp:Transcript_120294/g.340861  ORF Transcript_120294/g.340861 Transcript_120294/m.340861 type:complete len:263 (+) Transcript_120294:109-897(+)